MGFYCWVNLMQGRLLCHLLLPRHLLLQLELLERLLVSLAFLQ